MECFIKHGSTHVNVDNHGSPSFSTEKSLKQSSEFTFTEWDNKGLIPTKINEKFCLCKVQQYEANSKAKNYYQHLFAVHWINPTYGFF